ncbi:TRAP transporter substrate-binding protein DctP [Aquabacter sp. L1I39]|uniref:TRAP transporter substrate-binding protein DctP n=1 Tax=Aquabacter sp. L1I39 TaxID=2820278 RepID=UPI001ADBC10E|nr:TRAP transporter substrate-binding protein DctP [Aquabacter sp. L1I39]QTL04080.1 TRAP transporter substrate-binding protein DctP [Aquabacter sp. L1I39]
MNTIKLTKRGFLAASAAAGLSLAMPAIGARAQTVFKFKMSTDDAPGHHRHAVVTKWLDLLRKESNGQLDVELFHSAQLFNDVNVPRALRQGSIDMAMPGNWVLGGIDPNNDIFLLPMFFGVPQAAMHPVSDGAVGQAINKQIEEKLKVKVIGFWLDHGYSDTHSTRQISSSLDLKGLRVRSFGGAGTEARIRYFGADPILVPWAEVPMALSQGNFVAMYSNSASVASAKLWDSGIKCTVVERQFFHQYIPMISQAAYDKLPKPLQDLLVGSWKEHITEFRAMTTAAQQRAFDTLAANGVNVVRPEQGVLDGIRKGLMSTQDELVPKLKIDPDLVKQALAALKQST